MTETEDARAAIEPALCLQHAASGPGFRSISVTVLAAFSGPYLWVHTLFLPVGSPPPDASTVVDFADECALTQQGVARAAFPVFADERGAPLMRTLRGREGVQPFQQETGLIDGMRYDVYAVGMTPEGERTALSALPRGVPAMPFSGGDGRSGTPYLLRQLTEAELRDAPYLHAGHPLSRAGVTECARMLDNIGGMRALYERTGGTHGLPDALSCCYRITTDFDLSSYTEAYGGRGWQPIGGGEHGFSGVLEGIGPTVSILGMRLRGHGQAGEALGLIGHLQGGVLRSLWLDHPYIVAEAPPDGTLHVGGFAGTGWGSLTRLRVTYGRFGGDCAGDRSGAWVGGIIGSALGGTAMEALRVEDCVLESGPSGRAKIGGIAGMLQTQGGEGSDLNHSTIECIRCKPEAERIGEVQEARPCEEIPLAYKSPQAGVMKQALLEQQAYDM